MPVCRDPAFWTWSNQLGVGFFGQLVGAQHVQTAPDQLIRGVDPFGVEPFDNGANARQAGIAHLVGGEVNPLHQGATIDPLLDRCATPQTVGGFIKS